MEALKKEIESLEKQISETKNTALKELLEKKLNDKRIQLKAAGGDNTAILLSQLVSLVDKMGGTQNASGTTGAANPQEVEKYVKEALEKKKISVDDLDDSLKNYMIGKSVVSLKLSLPGKLGGTNVNAGKIDLRTLEKPLFQKIISDAIAMNNIYLYGAAGTGKSFIAGEIAKFFDYQLVELTCNQFVGPLDLIGGQTIKGYQRGKLERAWGCLDENGNPSTALGSVLLLDELPKLDPNTAGILNTALARVKEYRDGGLIAPSIENGKGDSIQKKNLIIIGTGNVKLNETSVDYEANFKQDLSLQDRFIGSTYEVKADHNFDCNVIMKGYKFIWIAVTKLREKILENRWQSIAFVSLRIMVNLKETYKTYRLWKDGKLNQEPGVVSALSKPKTLIDGIDSFLELFTPDQVVELKEAMEYETFKLIVIDKDKIDFKDFDVDTDEDNKVSNKMIQNLKS